MTNYWTDTNISFNPAAKDVFMVKESKKLQLEPNIGVGGREPALTKCFSSLHLRSAGRYVKNLLNVHVLCFCRNWEDLRSASWLWLCLDRSPAVTDHLMPAHILLYRYTTSMSHKKVVNLSHTNIIVPVICPYTLDICSISLTSKAIIWNFICKQVRFSYNLKS